MTDIYLIVSITSEKKFYSMTENYCVKFLMKLFIVLIGRVVLSKCVINFIKTTFTFPLTYLNPRKFEKMDSLIDYKIFYHYNLRLHL